MPCGCKKKTLIPAQPVPLARPVPPPPTTAPQSRVIIREGTASNPQKEIDRIVEKLNAITNQTSI
jgi:hypothetical protein